MTNTQHTPGPWRVIPPDHEHPSRAMVAGAPGNTIYDAPLTVETEANARLIEAKMVKLLQDAVDCLPRDDDTVAGFLDDAAALLARIHKEDR